MAAHPRDVPVSKTFDLRDVADANEAVEAMVGAGFSGRKDGFKVLMPREKRLAKRIGYTVTTGVSYGLRKRGLPRDVKYWTYIHDEDHYAIVLVSSDVADKMGL